MSSIVKRPRALSDLLEIWEYIAEDSEPRADAFIDTINAKIQALAAGPGMGRERGELGDGIRSFPVGRYVIFFRSFQNGIEIVRVLHGARDLDSLF